MFYYKTYFAYIPTKKKLLSFFQVLSKINLKSAYKVCSQKMTHIRKFHKMCIKSVFAGDTFVYNSSHLHMDSLAGEVTHAISTSGFSVLIFLTLNSSSAVDLSSSVLSCDDSSPLSSLSSRIHGW